VCVRDDEICFVSSLIQFRNRYTAMGWGKQPDAMKGLKADKAARKKITALTDGKTSASTFLIGAGMTNASQNGWYRCSHV
jgi:hypothetical protein